MKSEKRLELGIGSGNEKSYMAHVVFVKMWFDTDECWKKKWKRFKKKCKFNAKSKILLIIAIF